MSNGKSDSGGGPAKGAASTNPSKGDLKAAFVEARTAHKDTQRDSQSRDTKTKVESKTRTGTSFAKSHADQLPGSRPSFEAKAPNHWDAFNKARQDKNDPVMKKWREHTRANFERDRRIHASPVSKREKQALENLRQKPQPKLELHPAGSVLKKIEARASAERERRIHHINKRIDRVNGMARNHFERSR